MAIPMLAGCKIRVDHGAPFGPSAILGNHVATLLMTLEPYAPSLNRNHGEDRYTYSLYFVPLDGSGKEKVVPLGKGLPGSSLIRIVGDDGQLLWLNVHGYLGVDLEQGRVAKRSEDRTPVPNLRPATARTAKSVVRVYPSNRGLRGRTMVAGDGWTVETELDSHPAPQVLPGVSTTALVGQRPRVEGKVPEPLLVLVEHTTGKTTTRTLWR